MNNIRVIAPSQSWKNTSRVRYERAEARMKARGYTVTYGRHVHEISHLGTASPQARATDFNEAFADNDVDIVMALNGGWSSNEMLPYVDWDIVEQNPKPLVGFSDITALLNAVYAKTGQTTYLGPNFGTIGRMHQWQYTLDYFDAAMQNISKAFVKSAYWKTDSMKLQRRTLDWNILQPGKAEARLIGGNLGTFFLLQGTDYQPSFNKPYVLAIEDDAQDGKFAAREFSRRLESILQLDGARTNIRALLIGRFEPESGITSQVLGFILAERQLADIPIIASIDFGHTLPMITLPIGDMVAIDTSNKTPITLIK